MFDWRLKMLFASDGQRQLWIDPAAILSQRLSHDLSHRHVSPKGELPKPLVEIVRERDRYPASTFSALTRHQHHDITASGKRRGTRVTDLLIAALWLEVRDARAAAAALRARGLEPAEEPFEVATGWTVEVADPWGNVIGLTDYTMDPSRGRPTYQ
jgi:hypothetical protein